MKNARARAVDRSTAGSDALQHVLNAGRRVVARFQQRAHRVERCDMQLLWRKPLHDHRERLLRGLNRSLHRAARINNEHDVDVRFLRRLRHSLRHRCVRRSLQLPGQFAVAKVLRDIAGSLVFLLLDRFLPALLDWLMLQ